MKRILHSLSQPERLAAARQFDWWWLPGVLRAVTLAQGLFIGVVGGSGLLRVTLPLTLIAVAATALEARGHVRRWVPPVEAVTAAAVTAASGADAVIGLPYLVVPGFAAGLSFGLVSGVATALAGGAALALGRLATQPDDLWQGIATPAVQWGALALVMAVLGGWGHVQRQSRPAEERAYERASRLLEDLYDLTPLLTSGLDQGAIADSVFDDIQDGVGFHQAALLVVSAHGPQTVAARRARQSWLADIELTELPSEPGRVAPLRDVPGTFCVTGATDSGLVLAFEPISHPLDADRAHRASEALRQQERRLSASRTFSALREVAAHDERRRIAREIHDGIAQDLASLAYEAEAGASNGLTSDDVAERLRSLIRELRLSVFELQSERLSSVNVAESLIEHAGRVAAEADLELRLTIRESQTALEPRVAYEVSKIATEALTNVRRHAGARTLWLVVEHEPARLRVSVADDGKGLSSPTDPTSSGLRIMRDRAQSIGASLVISDRPGGGTLVDVEYPGPALEDGDGASRPR